MSSPVLHRLVVTLVVCTGPWVGARFLSASSFRVKGGPRRRLGHSLCPKQPSRLHDTSPTWRHTRARASSPCSQQSRVALVMSQANGLLTDGSRAPPSAQTSPCVAFLVQVTPDIQPHRSVAHLLLPETTLVLGLRSLFLTLTLLPWYSMTAPRWQVLLFPCMASSALRDCAGWCWPHAPKTNSFVLLCPLSLTRTVCDEARG